MWNARRHEPFAIDRSSSCSCWSLDAVNLAQHASHPENCRDVQCLLRTRETRYLLFNCFVALVPSVPRLHVHMAKKGTAKSVHLELEVLATKSSGRSRKKTDRGMSLSLRTSFISELHAPHLQLRLHGKQIPLELERRCRYLPRHQWISSKV